ncbi:cytochrome C biogenesis protein [Lichenicola cladoniae]|uniref:Cytochrome C biogenesis protein n=2 Tax=Lichenicola cladoniae TaxID=1484109 RepID=A0A6M8HWJ9_9PROT|nr:thioredoxin family protein [Lichenicola cladoniae]NPD65345.1 cytochrome C biogenesis protein [Acetobacteraceae bacterium]QKE92758.1 cytochrome C biogenesis protein [Lichenicola cladoniae]
MLCLSAIAAPSARAAESAAVTTDHDAVTLVTDQQGWAPGRALGVGLRLKLAPGWHTYWSNPGDAGEPATIAVTASGGGAGQTGTIIWPVPQRLPEGPLMSYAYTGDVLLPLKLVPTAASANDGAPLVIKATAEWLACATVCVPEQGTFSITLPAGPATASPQASPEAGLFEAAREAAPRPSPFAAHIARDGTFTLTGAGLSPTSVATAWLFPASTGLIDQTAVQTPVIHDGSITIPLKPASGFKPDRPFEALVVLRDPAGQQSALTVSATPGMPVPGGAGSTAGIPRMLGLALLGGLILNLMPCVFPVLAMKAMALSKLSGLARREQRLSALFYTAGILVAFGALGGLTLGLRAAGSSVGWGFQFQSLAFVAATCWLLFLVGLNLVGAFEVGGSLTGAGQGLASRRGHVGDFATGLLAVLVATPCTAPFMAGALAGALGAPALVGMSVFLTMGLGLALPYLLFACIPRLASSLPRPGVWMDILKQAMAFPIFAACAWLAWVASTEGGSAGVLTVAAGLVLLGTAAWLFGLSQRLAMSSAGTEGVRGTRFAGFLSLAFLLAALAMLPGLGKASSNGGQNAQASDGWEAFSEPKLASLRQSGRPVLVDMSAAWCVSCLVNERIAFQSASVRAAFAEHHVALLKGDWTLRDEAITRFLQAHGRDGVPFYIYYPAGADGQVWPQILTPNLVLHAIDATRAQ